MNNRAGFRGYIGTRMEMGRSTAQHIQQLVMRDYCKARDMRYLLAAVEYRMQGCTMVLDAIMQELPHIEGIIMYSLYLFPQSKAKRMELYERIITHGCSLHMAVEGYVIKNWEDALKLEDVWLVHEVIQHQPTQLFTELHTLEYQNYATA